MNWLTQPLERVFLRPLRSLGGLSFDVSFPRSTRTP